MINVDKKNLFYHKFIIKTDKKSYLIISYLRHLRSIPIPEW